jgi:hypothetical protein
MQLEQFNYKFRHCPGNQLAGPDALSRVAICAAVSSSLPTPTIEERPRIIDEYHKEFGHQSWKKVFQGLKERFSWKGMRKEVFEQIKSCQICFMFNSATVTIGTHLESIQVDHPRELLCIDFYGPMPFTATNDRYAMIGIDHFSKMAFGKVIQRKDTDTAIQFLQELFQQYGQFKMILGDRDSVFRSKKFKAFLQESGCDLHVAQATHAEANGCCERFIRTLGTIMAKLLYTKELNPTQWNQVLEESIGCYNGTPHSTTNAVPGEVFLEQAWHLPADQRYGVIRNEPGINSWNEVEEASRIQQGSSIKTANRSKWRHFSAGDHVALVPRLANEKKHNADRRFRKRKQGPYQVIAHEGQGIYTLTDGQQKFRSNAWELIPYSPSIFQRGGE